MGKKICIWCDKTLAESIDRKDGYGLCSKCKKVVDESFFKHIADVNEVKKKKETKK